MDQLASNPVDQMHAEASPVQSDAQQQSTNIEQTKLLVEKKGSPISQMIDKDGQFMYVLFILSI